MSSSPERRLNTEDSPTPNKGKLIVGDFNNVDGDSPPGSGEGFGWCSVQEGGTVGGIGGTRQMLGVSKAKIEIEGEVHKIPFKSISMKALKGKLGIVGIIGSRYLNKLDYVIDYKLMTLHRAK